jgi:hypothetical protein
MKKILILIFISTLFITKSSASHYLGGEITWECLSNGAFVFHLNRYRDCTGVSGNMSNETLTISGSPLPANGVSSIIMRFNTTLFNATGQGDLSQYCSSSYGTQPSCGSGALGSMQLFPFVSDTIQLTGSPPSSGWLFSHTSPCCYPNDYQNIHTSNQLLLMSRMYGFPGKNVDTCYSSSPIFADLPSVQFCRDDTVEFSFAAISDFGDSLDYSNGRLYAAPHLNPVPLPFVSGYSINDVTSNTSFHPNNIPYTLNQASGDVLFYVNNFFGLQKFASSTIVKSYRNGVLLASVNRIIPIVIQDCDTMPSGAQNTSPKLTPPFSNNGVPGYSTSVVAGSIVNVTVHFYDNDSTGVGTGRQEITLVPFGESLSRNLINSTNCLLPNDTSCATFGFTPTLDSNLRPARYAYKALGVGYVFLNWNTDCDDLTTAGTAKTHYFTFKIFDDHCPLPKTTYKTVAVTVTPSPNCNTITSLQSMDLLQYISLYPNPTNGQFSIALGASADCVEVQIRNIQGQLVQEQQFLNQSNLELDIKGKAGVYFIHVTNDKGERANLKVVKQ